MVTIVLSVMMVAHTSRIEVRQNNVLTTQPIIRGDSHLSTTIGYFSSLIVPGAPVVLPFLNNFTVNDDTFVNPTTNRHPVNKQYITVTGHLRTNTFYGPVQKIYYNDSGWELEGLEASHHTLPYILDNF